MTTFLAHPSAPPAPAVVGRDTPAADAARAAASRPIPDSTATTRGSRGERSNLPVGQPTHPAGGPAARAVYRRSPESWRLAGRPFHPQQRTLSLGEQRVQMADRLIYGGAGVLAGLMVLYVIAQRVFG